MKVSNRALIISLFHHLEHEDFMVAKAGEDGALEPGTSNSVLQPGNDTRHFHDIHKNLARDTNTADRGKYILPVLPNREETWI